MPRELFRPVQALGLDPNPRFSTDIIRKLQIEMNTSAPDFSRQRLTRSDPNVRPVRTAPARAENRALGSGRSEQESANREKERNNRRRRMPGAYRHQSDCRVC